MLFFVPDGRAQDKKFLKYGELIGSFEDHIRQELADFLPIVFFSEST